MTPDSAAAEWSPLDALRDLCNPDDRLHAALPTERDGDDLYVLTVRLQDARETEGEVLHLRTAVVDLLDQRAEWTSTGMVVPLSANLPVGLGRALVALGNVRGDRDREVLVRNAMGGGDDDLAETLLGVEDATAAARAVDGDPATTTEPEGLSVDVSDLREAAGADTETETAAEAESAAESAAAGEGGDVDMGDLREDRRDVEMRTCDDCGARRPAPEVATVALGGVEYVTCRGACVGDGESDGDGGGGGA